MHWNNESNKRRTLGNFLSDQQEDKTGIWHHASSQFSWWSDFSKHLSSYTTCRGLRKTSMALCIQMYKQAQQPACFTPGLVRNDTDHPSYNRPCHDLGCCTKEEKQGRRVTPNHNNSLVEKRKTERISNTNCPARDPRDPRVSAVPCGYTADQVLTYTNTKILLLNRPSRKKYLTLMKMKFLTSEPRSRSFPDST